MCYCMMVGGGVRSKVLVRAGWWCYGKVDVVVGRLVLLCAGYCWYDLFDLVVGGVGLL